MATAEDGKLAKMIIRAYEAPSGPKDTPKLSGDEYEVLVNPASYKLSRRIAYSDRRVQGKSGAEARYAQTIPSTLEFELWFDSTLEPNDDSESTNEERPDLNEELTNFRKLVYDYNGSQHRPRRVQILFGSTTFDGVLTEMIYHYQLFDNTGVPLRLKATVTFRESKPNFQRESEDKPSSPDLTHSRTVTEGDTLPLLAESIYGDPSYYIELARVNQLAAFRKLRTGQTLILPPIDKTSS